MPSYTLELKSLPCQKAKNIKISKLIGVITKEERETIILYTETDNSWDVQSSNIRFIRKLLKLKSFLLKEVLEKEGIIYEIRGTLPYWGIQFANKKRIGNTTTFSKN